MLFLLVFMACVMMFLFAMQHGVKEHRGHIAVGNHWRDDLGCSPNMYIFSIKGTILALIITTGPSVAQALDVRITGPSAAANVELNWQPNTGKQYSILQGVDMQRWSEIGLQGSENGKLKVPLALSHHQFFRVMEQDNPLSLGLDLYHSFNNDEGSILVSDWPEEGVLEAPAGILSAPGIIGSAAQFGFAAQQYLRGVDGEQFSASESSFFLSFWLFKDTGPMTQMILEKRGEYMIYEASENLTFRVTRASPGSVTVQTDGVSLTPGQWHHVIVWYDGNRNTINLRVNGGEIFTERNPFGIGVSSEQLTLGYGLFSSVQNRNWFNGRIDEIYFAKRSPDFYEISALYSNGAGIPYPFTEPVRSADSLLEGSITWDGPSDQPLVLAGGQEIPDSIIGRGRFYNRTLSQFDRVASRTKFSPGDKFSISFWARLDSVDAGTSPILGKAEVEGAVEYSFYHRPGIIGVDLGMTDRIVTLEGVCDSRLGEWTHVGLSVDGDSGLASLLINGELVGSAKVSLPFNPPASRLTIGCTNLQVDNSNQFFHGAIDEFRFHRRVLEPLEFRALYLKGTGVVCWGDSFTAGPGATPYPELLGSLRDRVVLNHGHFGASPEFLKGKIENNDVETAWVTVIWVGWTIYRYPVLRETVEPSLAAMVRKLKSKQPDARFVIMNIANHHHPDWEEGGEEHPNDVRESLAAINAMIAANYPDNFIDLDNHFINVYEPIDEDDVADQAIGIIPRSLRINLLDGDQNFNDDTHLNNAGNAEVANLVHIFLKEKGW